MQNITLHTENEDDTDHLNESNITRRVNSGSSGVWIVDVRNVDSAHELKSGGVEIMFSDGSTEEVGNAELVGVF